jgi:hypothetical protein
MVHLAFFCPKTLFTKFIIPREVFFDGCVMTLPEKRAVPQFFSRVTLHYAACGFYLPESLLYPNINFRKRLFLRRMRKYLDGCGICLLERPFFPNSYFLVRFFWSSLGYFMLDAAFKCRAMLTENQHVSFSTPQSNFLIGGP